jgi:hypothetical protein
MEFAANGVRPYLIVALTGMLIEGELNGERFALSVDNPHACNDRRSKAVVEVMALVPPFDFGEP